MPANDDTQAERHELSEKVRSREVRKLWVRRTPDRTLWHGLGTAGIIGWSIAVPTLIGVLAGLWLDRRWPGVFSWSLALLLAGVTLGCLNAWYWVSLEAKMIEREETEKDIER